MTPMKIDEHVGSRRVRTSDTPTGEGTSRIRDVLRRLSREIYARK